MAMFFIPVIAPDHYEAFRRTLKSDLPDTYDQWLQLRSERATNFLARDHVVEDVDVEPNEFERHCRRTGASGSLQSLWNFAIEKVIGEDE